MFQITVIPGAAERRPGDEVKLFSAIQRSFKNHWIPAFTGMTGKNLSIEEKGGFFMKIAVSSTGKDLHSEIDPRLGRCAFFIVIETENMGFEVFDNENIALSGGAGIQAAKFLSSKNVGAVLTGSCGPNAMKTLSAAGIQVFTGLTGSVAEAVEKYKQGILSPSTKATVEEKSGLGQSEAIESMMPWSRGGQGAGGRGRGVGGGGKGRGMGGGRKLV